MEERYPKRVVDGVAFYDLANPGWTAGAHYYTNLFFALRSLDDAERPLVGLAAVVLNLSKKYKPFQERARGLGYRALNARQLSDLEHVCQELRTVYARLLGVERSALAQEMEDDPDLGLEQKASP